MVIPSSAASEQMIQGSAMTSAGTQSAGGYEGLVWLLAQPSTYRDLKASFVSPVLPSPLLDVEMGGGEGPRVV